MADGGVLLLGRDQFVLFAPFPFTRDPIAQLSRMTGLIHRTRKRLQLLWRLVYCGYMMRKDVRRVKIHSHPFGNWFCLIELTLKHVSTMRATYLRHMIEST